MVEITWAQLKSLLDASSIRAKVITSSDYYKVFGYDGPFECFCEIDRHPTDAADLLDFEANYLPSISNLIEPLDTDTGGLIVAARKLPSVWYPEFREIELTTATLNSVHDKNRSDVDIGHSSLKFFEADGSEIASPTQGYLDTNCSETHLIFNPGVKWAIAGGTVRQVAIPSEALYVWVDIKILVAPSTYVTLPYANGGLNMEFQNVRESVGKMGENYSFFNAGDQFVWIFKHGTGSAQKHRFRILLDIAFENPS